MDDVYIVTVAECPFSRLIVFCESPVSSGDGFEDIAFLFHRTGNCRFFLGDSFGFSFFPFGTRIDSHVFMVPPALPFQVLHIRIRFETPEFFVRLQDGRIVFNQFRHFIPHSRCAEHKKVQPML